MDKSWMKIRDRADPTYIKGIDNFLEWACSQPGVDNRIRCPCKRCRNVIFKLRNEIRFHLLKNGILDTYDVWEYHGESLVRSSSPLNESSDQIQDNDDKEDDITGTSQQETLMDKSWMKIQDRADPTYIKGIHNFLDWACSQPGVNNRIRCPCKECRNITFKLRNEVRFHLMKKGFLDTYEVWEYHGESSFPLNKSNDQIQDNDVGEDDIIATPKQETLMDKSWMKIRKRATPTYVKGIDDFLDWACSQPGVNDRIRCPCKVCRNVLFRLRNEVRVHLLKNGFLETYEVWEYHGESLIRSSSPHNESNDQLQDNDVEEDDIIAAPQQKILMDKSWMKIRNRATPTYVKGIDNFLDWACSQPGVNDRIRCPCKVCGNVVFRLRNEVRVHLLKKGFLESYEVWEYHGESLIRSSSPNNESNDQIQDNDVEEDDIIAAPQQKILMDKSWMKIRNRATPTYVKGIDNFLHWACNQPGVNDRIRCPCKVCGNVVFRLRNEVRVHLLENGFLETYVVWEFHGESVIRSSSPHNERNDQIQGNDVAEDDIIATPLQETLMDKSWMKIRNRATPTYVKGIDNFLDWACSQPGVNDRIRCPCKVCGNVKFRLRNKVRVHLLKNGFLETYEVWEYHGESLIRSSSSHNESNDHIQDNDVEEDDIIAKPQQKILMDKSWMKIWNRATPTYVKGIDNFLYWSCSQPGVNDRIRCPCKVCGNLVFRMRNEVRVHLLKNGFLETYVVWEYHGESAIRSSSPHNERNDQIQDNDVEEDDNIAMPQPKILMDKSWMKIRNRATPTYVKGIDNFLDWACSQPGVNDRIRCPCKVCGNVVFRMRNEVRVHLLKNGFLETYVVWEYHGESAIRSSSSHNERNDQIHDNDVEEDDIIATPLQETLMDKSWMKIRNRATPTYVKGIDNFLDWACSQPGVNDRIRCPCKVCGNVLFRMRNEVRVHLLKSGFLETYEVWEYHGESLIRSSSPHNESNDQLQDNDVEEDDFIAAPQQKILMDKSWMKIRNRATPTYVKGIYNFLDWACSQPGVNDRIRCPCKVCGNVLFRMRNEVRVHLLKNGFLETYVVWDYHGESAIRSSSPHNESNDQIQDNDVEEDDIIATPLQKIVMDKSWMMIRNRSTPTYVKGIDNFLNWACSQPEVNDRIRCPCKVCGNVVFMLRNEVRVHLLKNGFLESYVEWEHHGEYAIRSSSPHNESNDHIQDNDVEDDIIATPLQKVLMDKSWMKIRNRGTPTYVKGIDNFLDWACSQPGVNDRIRCPCKVCGNVLFRMRNEVRVHLLKNGFLETYVMWDYHGESIIRSSSPLNESNVHVEDNDVNWDDIIATPQLELLMDKSWMKIQNRATPTYVKGVDSFLDWACSQPGVNNRIWCPCKVCRNVIFMLRNDVRVHLLKNGFLDTYEVWEYHGQSFLRSSSSLNEGNNKIQDNDVEMDGIISTAQQQLLMDKSWIKIRNRATPTYVKGIDNFLNWACSQPGVNNRIRCPCKVCINVKFKLRNEVRVHLLKKGFLETYEVWEYHGEPVIKSPSPDNDRNDQVQDNGVEEDDITTTIERETLLDKSWMKIRDRADPTYIKGIDDFLEWACSQPGVDDRIRCPCKRCKNVIFKFRNEIRFHLLKNGFLDTYKVWEYHGESLIRSSSALDKSNDLIEDNDVEEDDITATSHQGTLMDKSWMKIRDRADPTYIKGIDNFLKWACSQPGVDNRIRCPCKKCRNLIFKLRNEIRVHLLKNGFLDTYEVWEYHGESLIRSSSPHIESNVQIHDNDLEEDDITATSQQETLMDKSWMKIRDRADPAYVKGIVNFLVWACRQPGVNNRIRCPCKVCRNAVFKLRNETRVHLLKNGFLDTYNVWEYHGESLIKSSTPLNDKKRDNGVEEDVFTSTSRQNIFMDKSWMKIRDRADPTYIKGIDNFLEWACSQPEVNNRIRCPCKECNNLIFKMRNEVRLHLLKKGFLDTYEVWEFHGEPLVRSSPNLNKSNGQRQVIDVEEHDITATTQQGRSQIVVASASGSGTPSTKRGRKRRRI